MQEEPSEEQMNTVQSLKVQNDLMRAQLSPCTPSETPTFVLEGHQDNDNEHDEEECQRKLRQDSSAAIITEGSSTLDKDRAPIPSDFAMPINKRGKLTGSKTFGRISQNNSSRNVYSPLKEDQISEHRTSEDN